MSKNNISQPKRNFKRWKKKQDFFLLSQLVVEKELPMEPYMWVEEEVLINVARINAMEVCCTLLKLSMEYKAPAIDECNLFSHLLNLGYPYYACY